MAKKLSKKKKEKIISITISLIVVIFASIFGYLYQSNTFNLKDKFSPNVNTNKVVISSEEYNSAIKTILENYDKYDTSKELVINDNKPFFSADDYKKAEKVFEEYSDLDKYNRCGVAFATICKEIMPTELRGDIQSVTPSGWQKKSEQPDKKQHYNRCHLIGHQLAGENANPKNLITGTRELNVGYNTDKKDGMLVYENQVADYVKNNNKKGKNVHVLYRVTPIFFENELVCRCLLMEGISLEDRNSEFGPAISFNVLLFNVGNGIAIDYKTGKVSKAK